MLKKGVPLHEFVDLDRLLDLQSFTVLLNSIGFTKASISKPYQPLVQGIF